MDNTQLTAMTVKDLRECAKRLGIKRISTLKQKDLIEAVAALGDAASAVAADVLAEKENAKSGNKIAKSSETDSQTDIKDGEETKKTKKSGSKKSDAAETKPAKQTAKKKSAKAGEKIAESDETDAGETDDDGVAETEGAETESETSAAAAAEVPKEPDSIFIDRGAILPEYIPGTCLYALVRDPGTLFVYWNTTFESPDGWIVTAYDVSGNVLQSFSSPMRRSGRGYFRVPTARVARVTLACVDSAGQTETRLQSRIRLAQQLGIAASDGAPGERWVDVLRHQVVREAPASGRAPGYDFAAVEHIRSKDAAWTAGGYDRSQDMQNMPKDATSSRFGRLSDTPSSDSLIGSSDKLVRR